MNSTHWHMDLDSNVGNFDRLARYVTGAALIGVILVAAPIPVGWANLLPLIAIPIVISAIIGWDPLYSIFQKRPIDKLSNQPKIVSTTEGRRAQVQEPLTSTADRKAA